MFGEPYFSFLITTALKFIIFKVLLCVTTHPKYSDHGIYDKIFFIEISCLFHSTIVYYCLESSWKRLFDMSFQRKTYCNSTRTEITYCTLSWQSKQLFYLIFCVIYFEIFVRHGLLLYFNNILWPWIILYTYLFFFKLKITLRFCRSVQL